MFAARVGEVRSVENRARELDAAEGRLTEVGSAHIAVRETHYLGVDHPEVDVFEAAGAELDMTERRAGEVEADQPAVVGEHTRERGFGELCAGRIDRGEDNITQLEPVEPQPGERDADEARALNADVVCADVHRVARDRRTDGRGDLGLVDVGVVLDRERTSGQLVVDPRRVHLHPPMVAPGASIGKPDADVRFGLDQRREPTMTATERHAGFTRRTEHVVVDADGHVCEPVDLWERELPAGMRERGPRVRFNDELATQQVLVEDHVAIPMGLAGLGNAGMHKNQDFGNSLNYPDDLHRGGWDPAERLAVMDAEGIDIAVLYCGLGQSLGGFTDRALAVACHQVWNDWIADWTSKDRDRLIPTAVIPAHDPAAAAREVERARAMGLVAGVIRPNPVLGKPLWHPAFDPMYEALAATGMPLGLHGAGLFDIEGTSKRMVDLMAMGTHHALILFFDQYLTLSGLVYGGVLERHPDLQVLVLECGGGWIAHWMDRLDEFLEAYEWSLPAKLSLTPSEYFQRNCVISFDPGERTMGAMAELAGDGNLIWASDFPHSDAKYPGVVDELMESVGHLPDDRARKILGTNAARVYGIEAELAKREAMR